MDRDPVTTNPELYRVAMENDRVRVTWVPAQEHVGHNVGDSATHVFFVELKEPAPRPGSG